MKTVDWVDRNMNYSSQIDVGMDGVDASDKKRKFVRWEFPLTAISFALSNVASIPASTTTI